MIGAAHAVEIPFVFHLVGDHRLHVLIGPDAPVALADAMHRAWVSFAMEGVPRVDGTNSWPSLPTTDEERPVLVFDADVSLLDDPQPATRRFWVGA